MKKLEEVKKMVNSYRVKAEVIERTDDIQENINNKYYYASKYEYFSISESNPSWVEIKKYIEELSFKEAVSLNDANELVKGYMVEVKKLLRMNEKQNTDDLNTDLKVMYCEGIPENLENDIFDFVYEINPDEYNKPSYVEQIADLVNTAIQYGKDSRTVKG